MDKRRGTRGRPQLQIRGTHAIPANYIILTLLLIINHRSMRCLLCRRAESANRRSTKREANTRIPNWRLMSETIKRKAMRQGPSLREARAVGRKRRKSRAERKGREATKQSGRAGSGRNRAADPFPMSQQPRELPLRHLLQAMGKRRRAGKRCETSDPLAWRSW